MVPCTYGTPDEGRVLLSIAFFFSSRRRHTRFDCDWSSDVCSSDLRSPALQRAWDRWINDRLPVMRQRWVAAASALRSVLGPAFWSALLRRVRSAARPQRQICFRAPGQPPETAPDVTELTTFAVLNLQAERR